MNDTPSKRRISTKTVYRNPWISVQEDETETLGGKKGIYGYMISRDSCMVVVLDDQDRIYFVRGFRYPSNSFGWELPGGGGEGEDLVVASKRELEEETGIIAGEWEKLGEALVCNGLMTEKMTVCLARQLHFDGHKEEGDETFSDMRFFDRAEIDTLIKAGEINDCQTLAGLQYYDSWKRTNREED